MRILIDANLSPRVAEMLSADGSETLHIGAAEPADGVGDADDANGNADHAHLAL